MADRIERYLGRLEAELDGRVEGVRREEILVEVEGHLRESEEAYRELGEPAELANRLAVDGFGGIDELQIQVAIRGDITSGSVRFWKKAAVVFGAVTGIGAVLSTSVFMSVPSLVSWTILPLAFLFTAATFVRTTIWKKVWLGWATGSVLVLALFVSAGRVAYRDGVPILGLQVGSMEVMSGGQSFNPSAREREYQDAVQYLEEVKRYKSVAHEGPMNLIPYSRPNQNGEVLMAAENGKNFMTIRTTDYDAARDSWLEHGDELIAWVHSLVARAESRRNEAQNFANSPLSNRIGPMLFVLGQYIGGTGLAVMIVSALGIGFGNLIASLLAGIRKLRWARSRN